MVNEIVEKEINTERLVSFLNHIESLKKKLQKHDNPIIITSSDLDEPGPRIIWANDMFCLKTEYNIDELLGKTPRILQGYMTSKTFKKNIRKNIRKEEKCSGITINYKKSKRPYLVEVTIMPIYDLSGNISNYIGFHNILEEDEEKVKSYYKTNFLKGFKIPNLILSSFAFSN